MSNPTPCPVCGGARAIYRIAQATGDRSVDWRLCDALLWCQTCAELGQPPAVWAEDEDERGGVKGRHES